MRQKNMFESVLKNKKPSSSKITSKMLDHRNFANITMPANIYLFKVSNSSAGKGVKNLHS